MKTLLVRTKNKLSELGLRPQKSFGQNFLVSDVIVDRILDEVLRLDPHHLVEVGPGVGALTDRLRVLDKPFQVIELDKGLAEFWRKEGLHVIENDALKFDWNKLNLVDSATLVSNLPYQISTHLVVDRCWGPRNLKSMVLMFQKEVAQRLLSEPRMKSYGFLSVMVQSHWQMKKIVEACPQDFWPAPKVASQVLSFARLPPPFPGKERGFLGFLKLCFAQRRKFLAKNLLALSLSTKDLDHEQILLWLGEVGVKPQARAEELTVSQFQQLYGLVLHNTQRLA